MEDRPEGVLLPVLARAGARHSGIQLGPNGVLKVSVTQAAERGKANQAIVAMLSKELRVPKSQFEIVAGKTSQRKRLLIRGLSTTQLQTRLASIVAAL